MPVPAFSRLVKNSVFRQPASGTWPGLLLQSFGISAIHGGQMCRHRSSTQVLDRWSKPTTASSVQRGEKAHGCAFSPAC
jgi:hypothetical protein